jgi:hypothetical protein
VVQIAFERRVRRIGNKVDDPIPNNFGGILFAVDAGLSVYELTPFLSGTDQVLEFVHAQNE